MAAVKTFQNNEMLSRRNQVPARIVDDKTESNAFILKRPIPNSLEAHRFKACEPMVSNGQK